MNETLGALASAVSITADATPTDPWATLIVRVLPVLAGAVIGYLFGLLRDANKTKADRNARHQDQILEAAVGVLETAEKVSRAAVTLHYQGKALERATESRTDTEKATQEFLQAMTEMADTSNLAKAHMLRIGILAPKLEQLAKDVIESARRPDLYLGTKRSKTLLDEHTKASEEFTGAVRAYLKVKR